MKFLFISPRFSGGIGGHAAMLANKLTQNGHQVKKLETTHLPIKNLKNPSFAVLSSIRSLIDRDSYDGEEAEEIQCSRRFHDFFKKEKLSQYYKPPPKKRNFEPVPSLAERLKKNKV